MCEPPSTVVLSLLNRPGKLVTSVKEIWLTAYHSSFAMQANPEIVKFVYDIGLGSLNSQGFGMIDIMEDNHE